MHAVKGIYKDGHVEFAEMPAFSELTEVLVVFPEHRIKRVKRIGGLFKGASIDYDAVEHELKDLSRVCEDHLLNPPLTPCF